MNNYFIKSDYKINIEPTTYQDTPQNSQKFQVSVYKYAAKWLLNNPRKSILDIGCGYGTKLNKYIYPIISSITGVDNEESINYCRNNYGFGKRIVEDVENPNTNHVEQFEFIICAGVVWHLINPNRLIEYIKLHSNRRTKILLSTPERDFRHGKSHTGPPKNTSHVREWNRSELLNYLRVCRAKILESKIVEFRPGVKSNQSVLLGFA